MRPFDLRLAREIEPVRGAIGLTAFISFCAAILLAVQSVLMAEVVAGAFLYHWQWNQMAQWVAVALAAWLGRVICNSAAEYVARYYGLKAVAAARNKAVARIVRVGRSRELNSGAVSSLLTRGVDGLEIYVSRYLPQLVIAAIVPLGLGLVILWLDPMSAVIIAATIPLIPAFMALVGWFTSDNVAKHWRQVLAVSGTLQDLLAGLPELKVFGRAKAQARRIRELGQQQQDATMKVLRLSFLSAFVLELLATLSVAIVAVAIGLRLVNGEIELWRGLAALILAPEIYAPMRMLGVHFHAAAEGLEAWGQLTKLMDAEPPMDGKLAIGRLQGVRWSGLTTTAGDRKIEVPDGSVAPGELVALVGPSGCGKTSLLETLLGLRHVVHGEVAWVDDTGDRPLPAIKLSTLHSQIGFVGQEAWLGEGTVREVITRGLNRTPDGEEMRELLVSLQLSPSLSIPISDRSQGVSVGQRRRYAIARALLRQPAVLLLDEPAASLDFETERIVIAAVRKYVDEGGIALVIAHRSGFRTAADRVLSFDLESGRV